MKEMRLAITMRVRT